MTHIPFQLPKELYSSEVFLEATSLVRFLRSKGFQAYFVGGAVRDMVLQRAIDDIDIATDASIEELLQLFPKAIQVGVQFGVIRHYKNGHEFEIATFRTESGYQDGRHPSIVKKASTYEEDASRRDFTINGLFYDPEKQVIVDCVGGMSDIEKKCIRTIGRAEDRFSEDKLRVLRAIRFSHVLGFSIHPDTWTALSHLASVVPQYVSGERIWDEFLKMHTKGVLKEALVSMYRIGLLQALFPFPVSEGAIHQAPKVENLALFFAVLWSDQPTLPEYIKKQFHVSNKDVTAMTNWYILQKELSPTCSDRTLVRLLALEYSEEILPLLQGVAWVHKKREELLPWIEQERTGAFSVMGRDLIQRGVRPGKELGTMLEEAFSLSIQKRELDKELLLKELFL